MTTKVTRVLTAVVFLFLSAEVVRAQPRITQKEGDTPHYMTLPLAMVDDPKIPRPRFEYVFSPDLQQLWIKALQQQDPDVRRRACYTIKLAHSRGMKGLEATVPTLKEILSKQGESSLVRLAAAKALIHLKEKSAVSGLLSLCQEDFFEYSLNIEPTLAKWKVADAKPLWQQRLTSSSSSTKLVLAIRGLAALEDKSTVKSLQSIVQTKSNSSAVRIAAAKSISRLAAAATAQELAKQFSASSSFVDGLIEAALLARQKDAESVKRLKVIASSHQLDLVRAEALQGLLNSDLAYVRANATEYMLSQEPRLRLVGIKALEKDTGASAITRITNRLNDKLPKVRNLARKILEAHAKSSPQLRELVSRQFTEARIEQFRWQGHEQTAILMANLNLKSKAILLAPLLDHEHRDVGVYVAWALSKLGDKRTFPAILRRATTLAGISRMDDPNMFENGMQFAHCLHTFGNNRYPPALPLLRRLVPKNMMIGQISRAVAVWALGKYYQGRKNEALCKMFVDRLDDAYGQFPEGAQVRMQAAIALGRIKTQLGEESLHNFKDDKVSAVAAACYWTLNKRHGTKIPPLEINKTGYDDWFLQSADGTGTGKKGKKKSK